MATDTSATDTERKPVGVEPEDDMGSWDDIYKATDSTETKMRKPPTKAFIETQIYYQLLPAVIILSLSRTDTVLDRAAIIQAAVSAHDALNHARSYGASVQVQGRCAYYIGVAQWLAPNATLGPVPFRQADRSKGGGLSPPEISRPRIGDRGRRWFEIAHDADYHSETESLPWECKCAGEWLRYLDKTEEKFQNRTVHDARERSYLGQAQIEIEERKKRFAASKSRVTSYRDQVEESESSDDDESLPAVPTIDVEDYSEPAARPRAPTPETANLRSAEREGDEAEEGEDGEEDVEHESEGEGGEYQEANRYQYKYRQDEYDTDDDDDDLYSVTPPRRFAALSPQSSPFDVEPRPDEEHPKYQQTYPPNEGFHQRHLLSPIEEEDEDADAPERTDPARPTIPTINEPETSDASSKSKDENQSSEEDVNYEVAQIRTPHQKTKNQKRSASDSPSQKKEIEGTDEDAEEVEFGSALRRTQSR